MKLTGCEDRLTAFFDTLSAELSASRTVHTDARARLMSRMRKRAAFVRPDLAKAGCLDFLKTNLSLDGFRHSLPREVKVEAAFFIRRVLENFTTSLDALSIQEVLDKRFLFDNWRFGPGASNGVKGTHTSQKIGQGMTCTTRCEPLVRRLRALNVYLSAFDSRNVGQGVTLIGGSRLTTVPKNEDTVRTIAIEPSGNMSLQLAAGLYFQYALSHIGLDITNQQPKNKILALTGSIDGSLATIDLSKASDMISTDLVRALLPSEWFDLLGSLRSPAIEHDGKWHDLHMISTMGNGFTFPLMTLIILSLVYANRRLRGGPNLFIDWGQTAVFGDDIIIPSREYESLTDVLACAGLIVNHDKSYFEGPFRESCGGDYMNGYNITPFYVKSLSVDHEIYIATNQLLEWSASHNFWPFDTFKLLKSQLRSDPFFVPEWSQPFQGIKTTQVRRRYKRLMLASPRITYQGEFEMMLACGGFINCDGTGVNTFTPRPKSLRVRPGEARIPRGFLDGRDPVSRSHGDSSRIATLIAMAE
jgi:hypothetical protein